MEISIDFRQHFFALITIDNEYTIAYGHYLSEFEFRSDILENLNSSYVEWVSGESKANIYLVRGSKLIPTIMMLSRELDQKQERLLLKLLRFLKIASV